MAGRREEGGERVVGRVVVGVDEDWVWDDAVGLGLGEVVMEDAVVVLVDAVVVEDAAEAKVIELEAEMLDKVVVAVDRVEIAEDRDSPVILGAIKVTPTTVLVLDTVPFNPGATNPGSNPKSTSANLTPPKNCIALAYLFLTPSNSCCTNPTASKTGISSVFESV